MTDTNLIGRRAALCSLAAFAALGIGAAGRPAFAASLDDLRKQGTVGERFDGLAVARDGGAKKVVKDVNAKRSKIYQREAKKTGADVTSVGKIYAKQIMKKAPSGTWFLNEKGKWVQK
ncbi:YdbL family protein [Pelagibius sp. Alg239-R121]|uniref:YdbL family protein n=1 Tax=Pelagibius sp. Alg239-R121 TaxID=2993448 RepID=UPI0024A69082|nr:YdbL family protein [Pelagibius sp. Alg239-R121]